MSDCAIQEKRISSSFSDSGDVFLVGEQLRLRMLSDDAKLIKDRRYHLRTYTQCFVGNATVDWLVKTGEASDREVAVMLMRILQDNDILHHVCDDHIFKDEMLFYRFRKDDGTFPKNKDTTVFIKGLALYNKLTKHKNNILNNNAFNGQKYPSSFYGKELLDWMIELPENVLRQRQYIIQDCRELLENGILHHVTHDHHFKDSPNILYQFAGKISRKRKLSYVLKKDRSRNDSEQSTASTEDMSMNNRNSHCLLCDSDSGFSHSQEIQLAESYSSGEDCSSLEESINIKSVQLRRVSVEELEDAHSPFVKVEINIFSDPVGYGFVVRGDSPTFVQTIDPCGPAAVAGLKVRHFICSVNGQNVLRMNHKDVAKLILQSEGYVRLIVMSHFRDASK